MIKLTKNLVLLACLVLLIATTIFCIPLGARSFAKIDSNSAKAELLMDYDTGQILSEKNAFLHLPIASVTKLTTLLLTFEAIERGDLSLEQNLVASEHASSMGGSQVFIDAGAEYKVLDLLHAIIISSANDAAIPAAAPAAAAPIPPVTPFLWIKQ